MSKILFESNNHRFSFIPAAPFWNEVEYILMIRILYISTSRASGDAGGKNLSDILEKSKKNNAGLGITGILVHGGGMFMQVLEGPDDQVMRKYVKILDDVRHSECRIVLITTTEERAFPAWSMGVLEMPDFEFQEIQEMITHRQETVKAQVFSEVIRIFIKKMRKK